MLQRVNNRILNYPGLPADDGRALTDALTQHLNSMELSQSLEKSTIQRLECSPDGASVDAFFENESSRRLDAVLLATGTRYRQLGVPGEDEGLGDYISQSSKGDGHRFAGQPVAVVGGGDAGLENALTLAGLDCSVTLLLRSEELRARPSFVDQVRIHPRIRIAAIPSTVERVEPSDGGCLLHIDGPGGLITREFAALFVRIGVAPVLPDGLESLTRDERGFIQVDRRCQTSQVSVFAAGDITNTPLRSVATAVGDGARAARAIGEYLDYL